jgi:hypothetical protein
MKKRLLEVLSALLLIALFPIAGALWLFTGLLVVGLTVTVIVPVLAYILTGYKWFGDVGFGSDEGAYELPAVIGFGWFYYLGDKLYNK